MPKLKKKLLTETLFAYVRPSNRRFLDAYVKRNKISRSGYIDSLLEAARKQIQVKEKAEVLPENASPTT